MKNKRQSKIVKIVRQTAVHTHDELITALNREGFNVTQATVSRDIKELGLIKVPSPDGASVYSLPEVARETNTARIEMISDTVRNITAALHTIVINTMPGMAPAVASSIDTTMSGDIIGSVAGDDTVLVIAESIAKAEELEIKLKTIFKAE